MCRVHCKIGNLNYNLFHRNLADSPLCSCGEDETDGHYFECCPNYSKESLDAWSAVLDLPWNIKTIYHGDPESTDEDNAKLQLAGQEYIKLTKRFK